MSWLLAEDVIFLGQNWIHGIARSVNFIFTLVLFALQFPWEPDGMVHGDPAHIVGLQYIWGAFELKKAYLMHPKQIFWIAALEGDIIYDIKQTCPLL